jgi:3-oxoacyl-[acyl-carrier-protein] synthase II
VNGDVAITGVGVVRDVDGSFDPKVELGFRGAKYLPAACQYLLAATARALADAGGCLDGVDEELRGVAMGTNGAASALHHEMDRTVITSRAEDLSPILAPFFSINLFGSRLAVQHALKGFNLTITSPRVAGLEAIEIGARSLRLGRSTLLLAGATEAPANPAEPGAGPPEAGAVALVCEPPEAAAARGGRVYGRCRVRTCFVPPCQAGDATGTLRGLVDGSAPLLAVLDDSPVSTAVAAALRQAGPFERVPVGSGCLEPMLRLADLLTGEWPASEQVLAVATGHGNVAVARLTEPGG